jgi:asparagine synthase (glutamine-hydrolysing)
MCGIAGYIGVNKEGVLAAMARSLSHRGPDSHGEASYLNNSVHFAHRRLAILDLSPQGHQPMVSRDGRWTVTFNGEIYNFRSLRQRLTGPWRGESDTEVLVEAIAQWGIDKTLQELCGMFAFAALDQQERVLYLVRDRAGEKPLYYHHEKDFFAFASESRAFAHHPSFKRDVCPDTLAQYFANGYVPSPLCIYRDTYKVLPGHVLSWDLTSHAKKEVCYWTEIPLASAPQNHAQSIRMLDSLLTGVIEDQMISDVPLGAFLSGGIDSSLVVSIMQKVAKKTTKTFAIGFDDPKLNEAPFAREVARHLKTEHHEIIVDGRQVLAALPKVIKAYDEPFADFSSIPTYLVAQYARQNVTVALTGDGGDESFGGYNRYRDYASMMKIPKLARRCVAVLASGSGMRGLLDSKAGPYRAEKLAFVMAAQSDAELYVRLRRLWGSRFPLKFNPEVKKLSWNRSNVVEMMREDFKCYLPDDLLVKVDRASMAHSLETRAPLLDHRVIEFARSLPLDSLIQGKTGKVILRDLLASYVPRELFDRPKAGFMPPLKNWLKSDLREWGEGLLNETPLPLNLDRDVIEKTWDEHQRGRADWTIQLWSVLSFLQWWKNQGEQT